ncbi:MAG TPA: 4'-phosphopantetheinyl transferase superfamily protein [Terriglobales bacterium]|nr:4'-phosphopantetheinyl transferase superfamily protein [Terriglobales bacterium]
MLNEVKSAPIADPGEPAATNVCWFEQTEASVPAEEDWLSPSEAAHLQRLRIPKRRCDWRLGRWTAKQAVAAYLNLSHEADSLRKVEIRPAPSGAPEVFIANRPAPVSISLSHRAGTAACLVARHGTDLGCDLEVIEPHTDAFIRDFFTTDEQSVIARAPAASQPLIVALLWSAKESALKALHEGLRLDTRDVRVLTNETDFNPLPPADAQTWRPLQVSAPNDLLFHGWWLHGDNLVRTLVASPRPALPKTM